MQNKFKGLLVPPLQDGEVFKKRVDGEISCMESGIVKNGFCGVNAEKCDECILSYKNKDILDEYIGVLNGAPELYRLPDGCQIKVRNGEDFGNISWFYKMFSEDGGILRFDSYDEDLDHEASKNYDIMEIIRVDGVILWKRKEVLEVTMEDLEDKYKCKVKVVE